MREVRESKGIYKPLTEHCEHISPDDNKFAFRKRQLFTQTFGLNDINVQHDTVDFSTAMIQLNFAVISVLLHEQVPLPLYVHQVCYPPTPSCQFQLCRNYVL